MTLGEADRLVARAILGVLADRTELYPSELVGDLRRRAPDLPPERVRPVLARLFAERQVARLWHRYLLPGDVARVRAAWLAMLRAQRHKFVGLETRYEATRDRITRWDGWRIGESET